MFARDITKECIQLTEEYPVVTITGPRQSGKTTLARSFSEYEYFNLELPENREFAANDPSTILQRLAYYPIYWE